MPGSLQRLVRHQLRVFKIHKPKRPAASAPTAKHISGIKSCQSVNCIPEKTIVICVVSGALRHGKKQRKKTPSADTPNASASRKLTQLNNVFIEFGVVMMPNVV